MQVLSVASECVPLVKTGGLADVTGALPAALAAEGVRMRVLLPGYRAVMARIEAVQTLHDTPDLFGGPARLLAGRAAGLDLLVVDAPHLYDRDGGLYLGPDGGDWPDNPERFAALCWMGAEIARGLTDWQPDVVQCHDWQAGFVPQYLRQAGGGPPTVMTVHNIAFTGSVDAARLGALRLAPEGYTPEGFEFYGRISALKAGLSAADAITTVSPTYARELMTPAFGMGLDGLLRARADRVSGILNGIDTALWNPATDPAITPYDTPEGKATSRAALIAEMGLDPGAPGPLCIVVSRLTEQKGLDLLLRCLPVLLEQGGQLALLGTGDPGMESAWRDAAAEHGPRVAVRIGYDETMSHRMMAGADAILVPSRFEPCGLTQLYALRYGTIPLVAQVGGLADTVIPANPAAVQAGVATGLHIHPLTDTALALGLQDLCALWRQRAVWRRMQINAMAQDVGWAGSARAYGALYARLADRS